MKQLLLGLQGKSSPSLLPPTLHPPSHQAQGETEVEQVAPRPVLFVSGTQPCSQVLSPHTQPYVYVYLTFEPIYTMSDLQTHIHTIVRVGGEPE